MSPLHLRSDTDIAAAAATALKWLVNGTHDRVRVQVENGWITLSSEVELNQERKAAYKAVSTLTGIRDVLSNITLKPKIDPEDVKQHIATAFLCSTLESKSIKVMYMAAKSSLQAPFPVGKKLKKLKRQYGQLPVCGK